MENKSKQKTVMPCRKDMQCTCPMCLASFQATWDLRRPLPLTNAFQTITNLDESYNDYYRTPTPPPFRRGKENGTPRSVGNDEKLCRPVTPFRLGSTSHLSLESTGNGLKPLDRAEHGRSKTEGRTWLKIFAILVCLVSLWPLLPRLALRTFPPVLSGTEVEGIVEESRARIRLEDRFDLIQRRLSQALPGQAVSNCTGSTAAWNLKDADVLVRSECTYYSSPAESVTVWGYPIATAGILSRATRDRHLMVISGRLLEWQDGGIECEIHDEGGSWVHPQWAASTIYLDAHTWILEYKEGIFSGLGSFSGIIHFIQHQVRKLRSNWNAAYDAGRAGVTYKTGSGVLPT